jgi:hypothetical protein
MKPSKGNFSTSIVKVKDKGHLRTGQEDPEEE